MYSLLWPLAPLVNWANNMFETRHDLTKFTQIFRRPVPRKVNDIGMWEKCAWFRARQALTRAPCRPATTLRLTVWANVRAAEVFTSVIQISLVAAFGTPLLLDNLMALSGLTPTEYPDLWVSHASNDGPEYHVAPSIKLVICTASSLCGFSLILLVRAVEGTDDSTTKLRLARDDFLERREKVREFQNAGEQAWQRGLGRARAIP